ncbi:MAG: D-glycero-alpha-D-manno-heptose-1,7-bisphosphate 7-phosphatase [Candidatus Brocadiales bacterium]
MSKRAVFMDRDGTIVQGVEYLRSLEELVLLPDAARAIRHFSENGYLTIIVTNQSGVARGYLTEEKLVEIHNRLISMLSEEGARIDAIYYCPHLAEGTVKEYSIDCQCRKPRPEMLLRAAREHDIDLSKSIMIGDTPADVMAGMAAGCKTVLIQSSDILSRRRRNTSEDSFDMPVNPDCIATGLMGAVALVS